MKVSLYKWYIWMDYYDEVTQCDVIRLVSLYS